MMTLNPLVPTFSTKAHPKPFLLGRPTKNQGLEPLEPTHAPTSSNRTSPPAVSLLQLEEQVQSLNTQLNQLKAFSDISLQQTNP